MREPFVEPNRRRHRLRMPRGEIAQQRFVSRLAAAEHHPRRVHRHQIGGSRGNQIEPFLVGQP
jgi:hypothetical protein